MLRGFHYPLTPKGKSTLNPRPPWHYSADFLDIEFWTDPKVVTAILPPGLDPDPSSEGHCNALFYDWQFTGANDEYVDPERYQYREFFLLLDALFEGRLVAYCPYIFVDNDAAIARGWTQGYPKRFGQVFQTRYYAATGKAGPPLAAGSKFAGSLTAPAVHELVENVAHDVKIEQAWAGEGYLTLPVAEGEEISDLAPIRCGKGIRASMAYIVDDLKTLKDLTK
jgi:acetoacetate decarboxylase